MNRKQSLASLSETAEGMEDADDIGYHVNQMDSQRCVTKLYYSKINN